MRRIVVGTALLFASVAGGIAGAGAARADVPLTDDWPVGRTVASRMWIDGDYYGALASAGGCTPAATDDSCA